MHQLPSLPLPLFHTAHSLSLTLSHNDPNKINTKITVTARYGSDEMFGPIMKHLTVPEAMMLDLFNSSCLPCLAVSLLLSWLVC